MEVGQIGNVELQVEFDAVSYWDEEYRMWKAEQGVYGIAIGTSSADIAETIEFTIEESVRYVA
jgi:Fibronectin type III-like domain